MLKYAEGETIPRIIAKIMEILINTPTMPDSFNVGLLKVILKDVFGDVMSVENIRPITISDVLAIIYENYFKEVFRGVSTDENQMGFKKQASTSHAIYVFREGQMFIKESYDQGYAIFFDFSKAFEKVNRSKMLSKLIGVIDELHWRSLYLYYDKSTVYIIGKDGEKSQKIRVMVGVKQGGPFSPILFIYYANKLIAIIKLSGRTISIEGRNIGVLGYADDTECQCRTPEDVRACIEIVEDFCSKEDIILNGKKTAWMKLGEKPLVHTITKKKVPKRRFYIFCTILS